MTKDVSVTVSAEAYEFSQLVVKFVSDLTAAVKAGVSVSTIPDVLGAVLSDMIPAIQKIQALPAEEKENLKAFVLAFELSATDIVASFLKK